MRVRKVPLDAGFSCPNRDGVLSRGGCLFCNEHGAGTGQLAKGDDLLAQWNHWRRRMDRPRAQRFIAYLQSYSNTYSSAREMRDVMHCAATLPETVGLCVGTRPDCLDCEKIEILANLPAEEFWLDLGLQSASDEVLSKANRGHSVEDFVRAVEMCAEAGIKVCAHLIAGLPGDSPAGFLRGIELLNSLPICGVKLHNLYVAKGSAYARDVLAGRLSLLTRDQYVALLVQAVSRLRPDIVIHRLASDPDSDDLYGPMWSDHKGTTLNELHLELERLGLWQGRALDVDGPYPLWFDADAQVAPALAI